MNLSGDYTFNAPQETIWSLLMDPDAIAEALPGVDKLVPVEGEAFTWTARAKVNVATVNGLYMGTIRMSDQVAPTQYRLTVNGEGQQSIIGGTVVFNLAYDEDQQVTHIAWDAEANISGKLARVGQRVIKAAAHLMSTRFFKGLEKQLDGSEEAAE
jgi:uncharacterized protein